MATANELPQIAIRQAVSHDFHRFRQRLMQIYLDAFTTGSYAHNAGQLTEFESYSYLCSILDDDGTGLMAFDSGLRAYPEFPIGFLLGSRPERDPLIAQTSIASYFHLDRCQYIAELAVDGFHRGRGVGHKLLSSYLESIDPVHTDAILVRTNDSDPRLVKFYESAGFRKLNEVSLQGGVIKKRYFAFCLKVST